MREVLSVDNAVKKFGSLQALAGATFSLHQGEHLALLGPNGAGKTTLIRSIGGRVRLDDGKITLLDQVLGGANGKTARQRMGVVPQDLAIYGLLSSRENMAIWGRLHGVPAPQLSERIDWALAWTGLADRADEPCQHFSGGMKRRLNIACAVLHQPEVILLDEPTVGVDPQSRQRIWEMLEHLRQQGASLLLTTHQLDEAQQVCDRIVIIDHGRVIADGTLDQLLEQTVGTKRRVILIFEGDVPAGLLDRGFVRDDHGRVHGFVERIAEELPALLAVVAAANARVTDLAVESPNLQAVFLHLTGRELRE